MSNYIEPIPFPNEKFGIIYADPPWDYKDKAAAGSRGASFKYTTQGMDYLISLPVQDIAADDCVLFMWVTMPMLLEGLVLIDAWGFKYKTCAFTWAKKNKVSDTWFFGIGNWTRSNAELCLLGVKGKPKRIDASVSSIIDTPIQEHSRKPAIVRDKIVQLMGDLPRIELFARQTVPGWTAWGNEVMQ